MDINTLAPDLLLSLGLFKARRAIRDFHLEDPSRVCTACRKRIPPGRAGRKCKECRQTAADTAADPARVVVVLQY